MDKSMITGLVIGVVVATAGASIASFNVLGKKEPAYAEVLGVKQITETVETPRQVCEDVPVTRQKPVQDQHIALCDPRYIRRRGLVGMRVCAGRKQGFHFYAVPSHILCDIRKEGGGGENSKRIVRCR